MVVIEKCPVCNGEAFQPLHSCLDTTVSHETFTISICQQCTLGITSPRPEDDQLARYYLSDNYISHSGQSNNLIGKVYLLARKYTLQWKKNIVERYSAKGTVLDLGCGTGEFLSTMQKSHWNIVGVEPSTIGRNKTQQLTGSPIYESLNQINASIVNAITLWHVLEHIPDLRKTLSRLSQLLAKTGTLYIAVPNYQSNDAHHYQENWAGYDVPRHLWHFSKQSMSVLLQDNGFKIISIVPMKLDAYYVSILSERNKNNFSEFPLLKGALQGLKSNLTGRAKTNQSSLLYIAQPV